MRVDQAVPKHRQIYASLHEAIASGRFAQGARLPSEAELVEQFQASRPTVARALRDLQDRGLVERRAGSGTYVRRPAVEKAHVFGLLIPDLGVTEIFEPICQGMVESPYHDKNALLWGNAGPREEGKESRARRLCRQYVHRGVSGVFFAPLELTTFKDEVNEEIVRTLDDANIRVVLLDRDICTYPKRSRYDLVGIDNRRAGFVITEHLIKAGSRRIAFLGRPQSAGTVDARIAGHREALYAAGLPVKPGLIWRGDASEVEFIRRQFHASNPDAIACANDHTAAQLMQSLQDLSIEVPEHVRIAGVDDVKYASFLRVPLTTLRQPCRQMGAVAMAVMLERIEHPETPVRDISLDFELVVRRSSG